MTAFTAKADATLQNMPVSPREGAPEGLFAVFDEALEVSPRNGNKPRQTLQRIQIPGQSADGLEAGSRVRVSVEKQPGQAFPRVVGAPEVLKGQAAPAAAVKTPSQPKRVLAAPSKPAASSGSSVPKKSPGRAGLRHPSPPG